MVHLIHNFLMVLSNLWYIFTADLQEIATALRNKDKCAIIPVIDEYTQFVPEDEWELFPEDMRPIFTYGAMT
jgi:hypothetical protein